MQLVGLVLLLLTLILIMSPVPYHRIAERGKDTKEFCRYVRRAMLVTLLLFALGLGIDVYIVVQKISGTIPGLISGIIAVSIALTFWYVIEFARRQVDGRTQMDKSSTENDEEKVTEVKLADKVDHVLTETRVVLPGAQALLGFQFSSVLVEGFNKLSEISQYLHLLSLMLIALSTILLMTPAAYHRIVERGEDTEHFHRLAGKFVLSAMVTLALGIIINFYVVVDKVTTSVSLALVGSGIMLFLFYGIWFGYTLYCRQRSRQT